MLHDVSREEEHKQNGASDVRNEGEVTKTFLIRKTIIIGTGLVAENGNGGPHDGSNKQITRIVHTEIDSTIGMQHGPCIEKEGESPVFENQHAERSQHKRIGGMAGGKTVVTASISVYDMHRMTDTAVEV